MNPDLARCDQEIAEILNRPEVQSGKAPAWLVALGINDWEVERELIQRDAGMRSVGEKSSTTLL